MTVTLLPKRRLLSNVATLKRDIVPMFTDPPLARVGLSEGEAEEARDNRRGKRCRFGTES